MKITLNLNECELVEGEESDEGDEEPPAPLPTFLVEVEKKVWRLVLVSLCALPCLQPLNIFIMSTPCTECHACLRVHRHRRRAPARPPWHPTWFGCARNAVPAPHMLYLFSHRQQSNPFYPSNSHHLLTAGVEENADVYFTDCGFLDEVRFR